MPRRPVPATRSVLVTGASTGIGNACAHYLAGRGWHVYAGVRREADFALLESSEGKITPLILDVTEEDSIEAAARQIEAAAKGLGGLVNNAGVVVPAPLEFVPLDELRRQFEVNTIGPIAVIQAVMPLLRRSTGRIVNIGSISGKIATPMMGPYSGSKFAIEALSDSLRNEIAPWGMHVALVDPGNIETPIWQKTTAFADEMLPTMPHEMEELYEELIANTRAMAKRSEETAIPAEDVARVVAHALGSNRPRIRYFVGTDAKLGSIVARLLPDGIRDRVVQRVVGV